MRTFTQLDTHTIDDTLSLKSKDRRRDNSTQVRRADGNSLVKKSLVDNYSVRANNAQLIKALREENSSLKNHLKQKEEEVAELKTQLKNALNKLRMRSNELGKNIVELDPLRKKVKRLEMYLKTTDS